jgi:hypothetical protein
MPCCFRPQGQLDKRWLSRRPSQAHGLMDSWTHGPVLGATWTLSARDGSFVIAFLALFVRMVGGEVLGILCSIMHRLRCTDERSDGLSTTGRASKPSLEHSNFTRADTIELVQGEDQQKSITHCRFNGRRLGLSWVSLLVDYFAGCHIIDRGACTKSQLR